MILVTGASGFVGRAVTSALLARGHAVRALSRKGSPDLPGIESVAGDAADPRVLDKAMKGCQAVIHLVGIIRADGANTFEHAHRVTTQQVVSACHRQGVRRIIHMSALGTRPSASTAYHRTKWEAEEIVRSSGLAWTIMRPSLIYGSGDGFVSLFAAMMRPPLSLLQAGVVPVLGDGTTLLQPIAVEDVAEAFCRALSRDASLAQTFDLCGPSPLSLKQILETIATAQGHHPTFLSASPLLYPFLLPIAWWQRHTPLLLTIPFSIAKALGCLMERLLKNPPLTRDQAHMLEEGSVGDPAPSITKLGIHPHPFRPESTRPVEKGLAQVG